MFLEEHPFWRGGGLVCRELENHSFFKASIPTRSFYSIHPFLQIILVVNLLCGKELNEFNPP